MAFPIIGSIVGGVSGLAQLGMGLLDRRKAKKERKAAQSFFEQNKYDIAESAKGALASAERQASGTRLPAEDIRRAQIQEATAGGAGALQTAATSSADVLSGLSDLYRGEQTAMQNLGIEGAERFDRNQAMLRGELNRMAEREDERWRQNVQLPYMQQMTRAGQLSSRGAQGISAGLGTIGQAAGAFAQLSSAENQYQDFLGQMGLGGGGGAQTDPRTGLQTTATPLNDWKQVGQRTQLKAMPFIHPR